MNKSKDQLSKRYIFVLGCPRSGTTWMWGLLKGHPDVEPMLIEKMSGYKHPGGIKNMEEGDLYNTTETGLLVSGLDDSEVLSIANKYKSNKIKILEKTPSNALEIERLLRLFPDSKIVYMIRDPRATINSINKSVFNGNKKLARNLDEAILLFNKYSNIMKPHLKNQHILTIRYEDLTDNVNQVMSSVYAHCGLKPYNNVQKPRAAITKNSNDLRLGKKDSYLAEMSKQEICKVEEGAKDFMKEFDYKASRKNSLIRFKNRFNL